MLQLVLDQLPILLYLYWTLATGAAIFALLPGNVAPGFRHAVLLSAARGKLCNDQSQANLGPLTNLTVPQRWFLHFYIAGTACNTALLVFAAFQNAPVKAVTLMNLILLELHLVRRSLETSCMMQYPADAKMHIIAYMFGLSYYIVLPLSCMQSELYVSTGVQSQPADELQGLDCRHYLGITTFLAGNALQWWSHNILANLRSKSQLQHTEQDFYKLPQGGPFELVSCPHYLGEIVIYTGLALLAAKETPLVLIILVWVVANLQLAAQPTHRWYQKRFKDYPVQRKALIPFLY